MSDFFDIPAYPSKGRNFTTTNTVLLSDTGPAGRIRLDGVARMLHDVATLDVEDLTFRPRMIWVLRSITLRVYRFPLYLDNLHLETCCSGQGKAWAERRTRIHIESQLLVDAAAIWVNLAGIGGGPKTLGEDFFNIR